MRIYKNTVSDALWDTLVKLMNLKVLDSFRLVGGTNLSLQLGHRMSVDIDLFSDAEYNSIDFNIMDQCLQEIFEIVDKGVGGNNSMGNSYFVGDYNNLVKLDIYYTDPFITNYKVTKGVRIASLQDISAMKLDVICRGGRKKDFWDIHELLNYFDWNELLSFYIQRYPYSFSEEEVIKSALNFSEAEDDFEPICLKNKYWELIKLDIEESLNKYLNRIRK